MIIVYLKAQKNKNGFRFSIDKSILNELKVKAKKVYVVEWKGEFSEVTQKS